MISKLPYGERLQRCLQEENNETRVRLFCKSLYLFLAIKILFMWPALADAVVYSPRLLATPMLRIVYAPLHLAYLSLDGFLVFMIVILVVALWIRVNYFTSFLIFWLSIGLSRLSGSMANGSDYILNFFLMLAIGLSSRPALKNPVLRSSQIMISNFVLLIGRIQLALVYLLSGYNKLTSPAWRSGEAVHSIVNLDYFFHPAVTLSLEPFASKALAWLILFFEVGFPILIGFRKIRVPVLCAGVCFHLGISIFLGLPDFGVLMILTYSLFVPLRESGRPMKGSSD